MLHPPIQRSAVHAFRSYLDLAKADRSILLPRQVVTTTHEDDRPSVKPEYLEVSVLFKEL